MKPFKDDGDRLFINRPINGATGDYHCVFNAAFLRACRDLYFIHEHKSFIIRDPLKESTFLLEIDKRMKKNLRKSFNYSMSCKNPNPKYK